MNVNSKPIDFEAESAAELDRIRAMVGQQVPLSHFYVRGVRPVLLQGSRSEYSLGQLLVSRPNRMDRGEGGRSIEPLQTRRC